MLLGRFPLKPRVQCARSQRKKANGIGFISGREREGKTFARLSVSGREEALRKPEQAGRQAGRQAGGCVLLPPIPAAKK